MRRLADYTLGVAIVLVHMVMMSWNNEKLETSWKSDKLELQPRRFR